MTILLLVIIYLCFISLGLPDSLLGSAWSLIHLDFNVDISLMGIVSMIISMSTIVSSLFSDKLNRKFGTYAIVIISIFLTAFSLLGFSLVPNFIIMCLIAVPYGLGAGAIDASLNNYVALNFKSKHMSFLHSFWGIGTIVSPYIMGFSIKNYSSWQKGYLLVSIIQFAIAIIVCCSYPVWKNKKIQEKDDNVVPKNLTFKEKLKITGVFLVLVMFLSYCSLESIGTNWVSSYYVAVKGLNSALAATFGSLFFIGITTSRLISGFITEKLGDKKMIILGMVFILLGIILLVIPNVNYYVSVVGFIICGMGAGPIYPAIVHSTPDNFGKENSQVIIGLQMAFAYIGSTFTPLLFGLISSALGIEILPFCFLFFLIIFCVLFIFLQKKLKKSKNMK